MTWVLLCALVFAVDGADGGRSSVQPLSNEDQEVVENLSLLQELESARDFDLLQELAIER